MARTPKRVNDNRGSAYDITANMEVDEAMEALNHLIKNPPETSRVLEIGPELAERILAEKNLSNRPMKTGKIKEYARDLADDNWGLTGDTIKFGSDGLLKDGQNRLVAVIRSQTPLTTHVVFGVDPSLFSRMDIGKNRTAADIFHIAGLSYAAQTAAQVRWLEILTSDNPDNRGAHFTNEALYDAFKTKYDRLALERSVKVAMEVKKATGAPVGSVAAIHYLLAEDDEDQATQFMTDWANGSPQVVGLQKRLSDLMVQTNNRVHESVRNALILQAWNEYKAGKKVRANQLDYTPGEDEFPLAA